jgi:hypothetical protein
MARTIRKTAVWTGALLALGWGLYVAGSRPLLAAAYAGRGPAPLARAIRGQGEHPLEHYLLLADARFVRAWVCAALALAATLVVWAWSRRLLRQRRNAPPRAPLRWRGVLKGLALSGATLGLLLLAALARHHALYGRPAKPPAGYEEPRYPLVNQAQAVGLLGWSYGTPEEAPPGSFLAVPFEKPAGVTRVGLFGCSYVAGAETARGHDFPSRLRADLEQAGLGSSVEIVNFGLHGYGMAQAYLLWDLLGRRYDLDAVIVVPFLFHEERDNSFTYGYGPPHARFVLDRPDAAPRLLPAAGDSRWDAERLYHRALPPWRYLRYDLKAPFLLRAVTADRWGIPRNPLYHRGPFERPQAEILELYAALFRRWAAETKRLILLTDDPPIYGLRSAVAAPNVEFVLSRADSAPDNTGLYRAWGGHSSALGNDLRARELCDYLTGRPRPQFRRLELRAADAPPAAPAPATPPLWSFTNVAVAIAGRPVAHFHQFGDNPAGTPYARPLPFARDRVAALLVQPAFGRLRFVPSPALLADGAPAVLRFAVGDRRVAVTVGTVEARAGVIGRVRLTGERFRGDGWTLRLDPDFPGAVEIEADRPARELTLTLGGEPLCRGERDLRGAAWPALARLLVPRRHRPAAARFALRNVAGATAELRADPGDYVSVEDLQPPRGRAQLLLAGDAGVSTAETCLEYELHNETGEPFPAERRPAIPPQTP